MLRRIEQEHFHVDDPENLIGCVHVDGHAAMTFVFQARDRFLVRQIVRQCESIDARRHAILRRLVAEFNDLLDHLSFRFIQCTFFFADWQGARLRTGITRQSVLPTLAQRSGVFSNTIFDPATSPRTPFPDNTIPANRFDQLARQVLQHYPLPNSTAANNYVRTAVEPDNQDQFDARDAIGARLLV